MALKESGRGVISLIRKYFPAVPVLPWDDGGVAIPKSEDN